MTSIFALLLSAVLIVIDQLMKLWAINTLNPVSTIPVISGLLDFTYVENYGAAFGIFSGKKWLLVGLTGIILCIIAFAIIKKLIKGNTLIFSASLILAGGIGNLIDRIMRGYVVDYIDINQLFSYPMFNFADCCVVIGTIIFVIYTLFFEGKKAEKN